MNINELKNKIEKEQKEVETLKEKKAKIEKQLKEKNDKILKYANQISQYELEKATQTLAGKGTSLREVMNAISKGDLSEIQAKLRDTNI